MFSLLGPTPTYTLFPYTTLFRSRTPKLRAVSDASAVSSEGSPEVPTVKAVMSPPRCWMAQHTRLESMRSEEHTSELQSQSNLVCRLLLEKKKKKNNDILRAQQTH